MDRSQPLRTTLKAFIIAFGAVCAIIGLTHVVLGPAAIPGSVAVNATMDSEDRFYGTLFIGYGIATIWCARHLTTRREAFYFLIALFFASGVARLVSLAIVGLPHPLFQFLTAIELILPVILWRWHAAAYRA